MSEEDIEKPELVVIVSTLEKVEEAHDGVGDEEEPKGQHDLDDRREIPANRLPLTHFLNLSCLTFTDRHSKGH